MSEDDIGRPKTSHLRPKKFNGVINFFNEDLCARTENLKNELSEKSLTQRAPGC